MQNLLIVDDAKIIHSIIKKALQDIYQIHDAYSGEEALEIVENIDPDIILLDVEMPGKNGYEVCEILKSNPKTEAIPVIFLSGHGERRDVMLGFEAGADDYIVKPFQDDALRAKLNVVGRYREQQENLTHQVEEAQKTAYTAITGSSDLGQVIHFVERCYDVTDYEGLANAMFQVSNYLQLNCTLLIKSHEGDFFYSSKSSKVSPLEQELITLLHKEKRFFDFDCRTQINYQHIAVLIKNMPLDDAERFGRIKDLFPAMLGTADAKISQLDTLNAIKDNTTDISNSFTMVTDSLNKIKESTDASQKLSLKIMREMMMDLDFKLPNMGLDSDQEQTLLDTIDQAINKSHDAIDLTSQFNEYFSKILNNLEALVAKQSQLQEELTHLTEATTEETDDEGYSMDVELF